MKIVLTRLHMLYRCNIKFYFKQNFFMFYNSFNIKMSCSILHFKLLYIK